MIKNLLQNYIKDYKITLTEISTSSFKNILNCLQSGTKNESYRNYRRERCGTQTFCRQPQLAEFC